MNKYLIVAQGINKAKFFCRVQEAILQNDPTAMVEFVAILPGAYEFLKKRNKSVILLSDVIKKSKNYYKISGINYEEFCEFEIARHPNFEKEYFKNAVEDYLSAFYYIFKELYMPTHILLWNSEEIHNRTVKFVAQSLGIERFFHFETGFFPGTMVVDSKGVNFKSSLKGYDFENVKVNQKVLSSYIEKLTSTRLNKVEAKKSKNFTTEEILLKVKEVLKSYIGLQDKYYYLEVPPRNFLKQLICLLESIRFNLFKKLKKDKEMAIYQKFTRNFKRIVFVPLQVPDDTQVLVNSTWINSMETLIDVCLKSIPKDIGIVFKTHPASIGKHSIKSYKQLLKIQDKAILVNYLDTHQLIRESSIVITINSTVGLEALLYRKPVIVLGNAFWAVEPIVKKAVNSSDLKKKILEIYNGYDGNIELVDKLLYQIIFCYLKEINFKNPTPKQLADLVSFIKDGVAKLE